jgi:hypothetical protein
LGFVSHNKYALETAIGKKWPKNQTNTEEDTYESPQLVYCKYVNTLVPVVNSSIEITPPTPKSWSDNDTNTIEDVVESSMGVHNEITSNL